FTPRFFLTTFVLLTGSLPAPAAEVRGTVSKIDLARKELVLDGRGPGVRGQVLTFALTPETQVLFGRQAGQLSDLAVGKRVRVGLETPTGQAVALVIHALGAKPAPGAPVTSDANTVSGVLRRVALTEREIVVISPGPGGEKETALAVPDNVT